MQDNELTPAGRRICPEHSEERRTSIVSTLGRKLPDPDESGTLRSDPGLVGQKACFFAAIDNAAVVKGINKALALIKLGRPFAYWRNQTRTSGESSGKF